MLLLDEDVGHGALVCDFLERILESSAVVYFPLVLACVLKQGGRGICYQSHPALARETARRGLAAATLSICSKGSRTLRRRLFITTSQSVIILSEVCVCVNKREVRTNSIIRDNLLRLGFCSRHCIWRDGASDNAAKQTFEVRNGGRVMEKKKEC